MIVKQRKEALRRIEILKQQGLKFVKPVKDTLKNKDVPIFENQGIPFRSVFYYLYGNQGQEPYDEIIKIKEEFEKEYKAYVYLILISHSNIGTCYNFLYVSNNEDEWEMDNEDLKYGTPIVYCHNRDMEIDEFGSIGIAYDNVCGGIFRNS